jgi:hypothetical protein
MRAARPPTRDGTPPSDSRPRGEPESGGARGLRHVEERTEPEKPANTLARHLERRVAADTGITAYRLVA